MTATNKTAPCARCGALNSASFDRCIRCGAPLSPFVASATKVAGAIDPAAMWGTKVIVALTCFVFATQLTVTAKSGLVAALLGGGSRPDLLRFGAMLISRDTLTLEPYRLLSAVFVHFGALHIVMNLMGLVNLARIAEPGVGTARFVNAYLATGIVGFLTNIAWDAFVDPHRGATPVLTAGASGAVFGIMGLVLGFLVRMRDRRWKQFAVQAVLYGVLWGFLINGANGGIRINNGAHLGGLASGVLLGVYYASRPRPVRLTVANLVAGLGLVAVVVSLLLAQRAARHVPPPIQAQQTCSPVQGCACGGVDALATCSVKGS